MRVVSGKAKGRKLAAVPTLGTRPILDRVKTALFDKIRPQIQGAKVLDLFAGSGSVGIEALSQGAAFCTFVELDKKAYQTVKKNLSSLEFENQAEVLHQDAFAFLKKTRKSYDLIYIAPPQYKSLWVDAMHYIAERPALLNAEKMIIVQVDPLEYEPLAMKEFVEIEKRKYGSTLLIFFTKPRQNSA